MFDIVSMVPASSTDLHAAGRAEMKQGLSDKVRSVATEKYVRPAIQSGKKQFSIPVKDLTRDLNAEGFPARHTPQICSALQTSKFLRDNGLEIAEIVGPPSKMSPTVVFRYRLAEPGGSHGDGVDSPGSTIVSTEAEDPSARAFRLTEKLRGLLKEELAEYGGGEAFIRWVRGYDEEDAA